VLPRARCIAERLDYLYFDLDEIKKDVYGRNPDNARKLAEGIPPDLETRAEEVILATLTATSREKHILNDPIPLHEQMVRDFEEFQVPLLLCPNNGSLDNTVDEFFIMLDRIRVLPGLDP
jgi:hypothetical protein